MIGDRIIPRPYHTRAAEEIIRFIADPAPGTRPVIAIAGESGSGKSEIAFELSRLYAEREVNVFVFAQDDYFLYPPKTNDLMRRKDISHVGPHEVNLERLDHDLDRFKKAARGESLEKPLVVFEEDRITEETIEPAPYDLGIAEGTYTGFLKNADYRVFLDRNYEETKGERIARKRDPIDEFSDKVLQIEHGIIRTERELADFIVNGDFTVTPTKKKGGRE